MRNATQSQHEVRNIQAESFGRITRCTSVATPMLQVPALGSANEADVASREALDASARRARAANGFGDAGEPAACRAGLGRAQAHTSRLREVVELPTALQLEVAARLDRSRRVAGLASAIWQGLTGSVNAGLTSSQVRHESADADRTPVRASIVFAPGDSPLLHKTSGMRELAADIVHVVTAVSRRLLVTWRKRQQAWDTYRALRDLDARTLRDIGLDRSEIRSIAAEVSGALEVTRMHAVHVERSY